MQDVSSRTPSPSPKASATKGPPSPMASATKGVNVQWTFIERPARSNFASFSNPVSEYTNNRINAYPSRYIQRRMDRPFPVSVTLAPWLKKLGINNQQPKGFTVFLRLPGMMRPMCTQNRFRILAL